MIFFSPKQFQYRDYFWFPEHFIKIRWVVLWLTCLTLISIEPNQIEPHRIVAISEVSKQNRTASLRKRYRIVSWRKLWFTSLEVDTDTLRICVITTDRDENKQCELFGSSLALPPLATRGHSEAQRWALARWLTLADLSGIKDHRSSIDNKTWCETFEAFSIPAILNQRGRNQCIIYLIYVAMIQI